MRFRNSQRYFGLRGGAGSVISSENGLCPRVPEAEIKLLAHEGAYKRAAPAVRLPAHVQAGTAIGIGQSHSRHGVGKLDERWIESYFIAAQMVFVVDRAGMHGGEAPGSQERDSVMLRADGEFRRYSNYLLRLAQKFASQLMGERDQCCALLLVRLVID